MQNYKEECKLGDLILRNSNQITKMEQHPFKTDFYSKKPKYQICCKWIWNSSLRDKPQEVTGPSAESNLHTYHTLSLGSLP